MNTHPLIAPVTLEHGERYGKLTVLKEVRTKRGTRYRVGCQCGYSGMLVKAKHLMEGRIGACLKCR